MKITPGGRSGHIQLGKRGEQAVADWLEEQGYSIWARNWRTGAGELDIVAWSGEALYFIEVKTLHRKSGFVPRGNFSPAQRLRNYRAAQVFLAQMGYPEIVSRFDLFELQYGKDEKLESFCRWNDYLPEFFPHRKNTEKITPEPESLPDIWWKRWWVKLNLFPCPVCGTGSGKGRGLICNECLAHLAVRKSGQRCRGCGCAVDGVLDMCSNCISSGLDPLWTDNISLWEHRGIGRDLVLKLKYGKCSELARPLGHLGAESVRNAGFSPDVIVSIPMSWSRRIFRFYNPAELFARAVSGYLKIPFCQALKCRHHSAYQKNLSRTARLKNRIGTFRCCRPKDIAGKRVLLVDDVFTTGATMTAASKVLLEAKAECIYVLTISRSKALFKKMSK